MEIKNSNASGVRPDATAGKPAASGRTGDGGGIEPARGGGPGGDRVTLTDTAQQLLGAGGTGSGAPVDRARVDALRQAIADGGYAPDAARTAQKLVDLDGKL